MAENRSWWHITCFAMEVCTEVVLELFLAGWIVIGQVKWAVLGGRVIRLRKEHVSKTGDMERDSIFSFRVFFRPCIDCHWFPRVYEIRHQVLNSTLKSSLSLSVQCFPISSSCCFYSRPWQPFSVPQRCPCFPISDFIHVVPSVWDALPPFQNPHPSVPLRCPPRAAVP